MSAQQVIEGHAYWSFVTAPNTRFTPCYSVNLLVDADLAADFKSRGFPVKEMDEGTALVIKRKVSKSNGEINEAPKLIDKYKKPLNLEVGNGSRVKVLCREWETTWKGQVFKGLDFEAMQVIDLVQYNSGLTIESAFDIEAEEEEL